MKMDAQRRVACWSLIGVVLLGWGSLSRAVNLTDNDTDDTNPQVDDDQVVWQGVDPNGDWEIFLSDGEETTQITENDTDDTLPQIDNGRIVWQGFEPNGIDLEIYLYNGHDILQITMNDTDDQNPRISGANVVWESWDGNDWEIWAYNAICDCMAQITMNDTDDAMPQVDDQQAVWQHGDGVDWEIVSTTLGLGPNPDDEEDDHMSGDPNDDVSLRITPRTLNLNSKGRWITARLKFSGEDFDGRDVDVDTLLLEGVVPAEKVKVQKKGRHIMMKFDRSEVEELLAEGDHVKVMVSGMLEDGETVFAATDVIRTIDRGKHHGNGNGHGHN